MKSILHRRIFITDTILSLVGAAIIGVVLTALLLALNINSFGLGGRARIDEAFASKSLASDYLSGNLVTGKNQFNDCLILGMALDQRASVRELAISPTIPFASEPDICAALHDNKVEGRYFYHNYIHGQTTLARYLIAFMPVADIRNLY